MNQRFAALLFIALSLAVSSCAPRGSSELERHLGKQEKDRYRAATANSPQGDVGKKIADVGQQLDTLETASDQTAVVKGSAEVADMLADLTTHAGYTSRPALAELASQYRVLSTADDFPVEKSEGGGLANVRLLVSRTYSALASELESTKFAL